MIKFFRIQWILPSLLISLLIIPFFNLTISSGIGQISRAIQHPLFMKAFIISLQTSLMSLCFIVLTGTPLAWWLSNHRSSLRHFGIWVDLPVIIPPAVVGIALLITFGREGLLGRPLHNLGIHVSFSWVAVVLAQIIVSAPFFIKAAVNAFQKVDSNSILVAKSLGANEIQSFLKVTIPLALPGLINAATLSWARALGEFGATLIFAGNLPGKTQTLPLAIYTALESDVEMAVAIALALGSLSMCLLLLFRFLIPFFLRNRLILSLEKKNPEK